VKKTQTFLGIDLPREPDKNPNGFGLRLSSTAFECTYDFQSARGQAHSKTQAHHPWFFVLAANSRSNSVSFVVPVQAPSSSFKPIQGILEKKDSLICMRHPPKMRRRRTTRLRNASARQGTILPCQYPKE
jgi:hypothetical protein